MRCQAAAAAADRDVVCRRYVRWSGRRKRIASSQRSLFSHAPTSATASAPSASHSITASFSRVLTGWLQPRSIVPLPAEWLGLAQGGQVTLLLSTEFNFAWRLARHARTAGIHAAGLAFFPARVMDVGQYATIRR